MATEISPLEVFLPEDVTFDATARMAGGGGGDLFKGKHPTKGTLALKRLRSRLSTDSGSTARNRELDAVIHEVGLWRKLRHPNLLSCFGILLSSGDLFLVSPWMDNGSLTHFVGRHPKADRTQLLRDAAEGLAYLHQNDIVHGDVKGLNALVTADHRVALCDFGRSKLVSTINTTTGAVGTLCWESPELLLGGPRTKEADVYAFGITIYEILSGQVPFSQYQQGGVVLAVAHRGERPPKDPPTSPLGDSYEEVWSIAEMCWAKAVNHRPEMAQVIQIWPSARIQEDERLPEIAKALVLRYQEHHDTADIGEAIRLYRKSLVLRPGGYPDRTEPLNGLGDALYQRYLEERNLADITEAIAIFRKVVQLHPPTHPSRALALSKLGNALRRQHQQDRDASVISESITIHREALQLRPSGHPDRALSLDNIASALWERYKHGQDPEDLEEANTLSGEAVHLRPPGHPQRAHSLNTFGNTLFVRYMRDRNTPDIDKAILLLREALELRTAGHPDRAQSLNSLGSALYGLYVYRHESVPDVAEAHTLFQEALQLRPPGHPDRAQSLNNIAMTLEVLHMRDEAIRAMEQALSITLANHPEYSRARQGLARLKGYQ